MGPIWLILHLLVQFLERKDPPRVPRRVKEMFVHREFLNSLALMPTSFLKVLAKWAVSA